MGACMLVRARAVERSAPLDEAFFLFSEETDWCYRFAQAGWKVSSSRTPSACTSAAPRTAAGCSARTCAATCASSRSTAACATPSGRGGCCALAAASAAGVPGAAARLAGMYRDAAEWLGARRRAGRCSNVTDAGCCSPRARDRVVLAFPGGGRARARAARRARPRSPGRSRSLFGALAVTFVVGGRSRDARPAARRGVAALPFALARARRGSGRCPCSARRVLGVPCGTSRARSAATASSTSRAFASCRLRRPLARGVGEFADGGLHPGYAFPLWHGFLALVARRLRRSLGRRAARGVVLAPLALLVAYEAGARSSAAWARRSRRLRAQVALIALAPARAAPTPRWGYPRPRRASAARPRALALALAYVERPSRRLLASVAAAGLALAVVHPTYAIFLWLPFGGLPRRPLARRARSSGGSRRRSPRSSSRRRVLLWLLPSSRHRLACPGKGRAAAGVRPSTRASSTSSRTRATGSRPRSSAGRRDRGCRAPLRARSPGSRSARAGPPTFSAAPRGRRGDARRAAVRPFSDLVSISQSRRAAGFWPLAFAFAGGFVVLAALMRGLVLPLALAGGIALQLAYPGEFDLRTPRGRAGARDLVRGRRRSRRARDRPVAASGGRAARRRGRSARRSSCCRSPSTRPPTGARRLRGPRARSRRARRGAARGRAGG